MDPATIMMLAGLASSAAGAMGAGASGGGTGQFPYEAMYLNDYGGTADKFATQNNFLTNQIAGMNNGEALPPILKKLLAQQQAGMSRQNYETYYGMPGQRTGILNSAREVGAATGIGPKATIAQTGKQLQNFSSAEKAIGEYIAGLGAQQGAAWTGNILNASNATPQGPRGQIVGGGMYSQPASNPWGDVGAAAMGAAPWMSGGAFNPAKAPSATGAADGGFGFYSQQPGSPASGGAAWSPSAPPQNYQYSMSGYKSPTAYSADINPNRTINGETMAQRTAKYGGWFQG